MEQIKSWISDHYVVCVSAIIFIGCIIGGWLYYTASRTGNDYHDVRQSVERVEKGIDRAERGAGAAQAEIKNAEVHVKRADEITGKLTERTQRNARELDESERIVNSMSERSERIQGIIADVEKSNQESEAQTGSSS